MNPTRLWPFFITLICALAACQMEPKATPTPSIEITPALTTPSHVPLTSTTTATQVPTETALPATATPVLPLSIQLGQTNVEDGIALDSGGDVDSAVVSAGNPAVEARSSGNGQALSSPDGNAVLDYYLQFRVDDQRMFAGQPTAHIEIEVEYFDRGTDSFRIQYDAQPGGSSDGRFYDGGSVIKTDTGAFRTAVFNLCNANFANRDNGADFRISDDGNGAEIIRSVKITFLTAGATSLSVDDFGANPLDDQPDSDAIQTALDQSCGGSTVIFTSGVNNSDYQGYLIDKTIFLTGMSAKQDMIFTSSDPSNHALLRATAGLKGYVVRLFARSRISNGGDIDNITFTNLDINGGREVRRCMGADGNEDGNDDNWGSWLPECSAAGDPWCSAGNIGMDGAMDWQDVEQDYLAHPSLWTTGIVVENVVNSQAECGTALALGGAAAVIRNVTVDTAGDHVHIRGCAMTDNDEGQTGWSDGITFTGPGHLITGNTIINPSDVGIVFFGGKNTTISNNTVHITSGNYGAFAGIAVHSWIFGNNAGVQVTGNRVVNEGDKVCGGLHVGINLGPHMWGGGCVKSPNPSAVGNDSCTGELPAPEGQLCRDAIYCRIWTYIPPGSTLTLRDNFVSGAQINYLVEGLDGEIEDTNNVSETPRLTDWYAARHGCNGLTWGALDRVAHHPTLPGWTDMLVHCER
jgi:parallel beta-helix repeat protein